MFCWISGDIFEIFFSWIYFRHVTTIRFVLWFGGSIGVFLLLFAHLFPKRTDRSYPGRSLGILISFIGLGLLMGHSLLITSLRDHRIENFFKTKPQGTTIAFVKERIVTTTKYRTSCSLILTYTIGNRNYEQEIPVENRMYGDSIRIAYILDNPLIIRKKHFDE
jgi:hypothetical protein